MWYTKEIESQPKTIAKTWNASIVKSLATRDRNAGFIDIRKRLKKLVIDMILGLELSMDERVRQKSKFIVVIARGDQNIFLVPPVKPVNVKRKLDSSQFSSVLGFWKGKKYKNMA